MKNPTPNTFGSRHKKFREGLTLIEILLSISILVILFVMLASALAYPQRAVTRAALKQNAISAATSITESFFAQNYWALDDYPAEQPIGGLYTVNGQTVVNGYNEARDPDPTSDEHYRYIRVEVSCPDNAGGDTVILETYRSSMYVP